MYLDSGGVYIFGTSPRGLGTLVPVVPLSGERDGREGLRKREKVRGKFLLSMYSPKEDRLLSTTTRPFLAGLYFKVGFSYDSSRSTTRPFPLQTPFSLTATATGTKKRGAPVESLRGDRVRPWTVEDEEG